MTQVLADKEVKNLIGTVIVGTDDRYLNPNGIELRLGRSVRFHSTMETMEINPGDYLKVGPGESVTICSLEKIDFSKTTLGKIFPDRQLMGLITPTTTMMREGISQVTTKIDSGYVGYLNWGLRNNSFRDIFIEQGEPIYKLTLMLLDGNDVPESLYGERDGDQYQDSAGIQKSNRRIKADMDTVIQPTKQSDPSISLEEAGFPFNQIAREFRSVRSEYKDSLIKLGTSLFGALSIVAGTVGGAYGSGIKISVISIILGVVGALALLSIVILNRKKT